MGQFKSRYTVSNMCFAEKDFHVTMDWNFFASGHGKGKGLQLMGSGAQLKELYGEQ